MMLAFIAYMKTGTWEERHDFLALLPRGQHGFEPFPGYVRFNRMNLKVSGLLLSFGIVPYLQACKIGPAFSTILFIINKAPG